MAGRGSNIPTGATLYAPLAGDLLRAEIEIIRQLAVEIRCETTVGEDVSLAELRRNFAAVILAVGAKKSRQLPIATGGSTWSPSPSSCARPTCRR